LPYNPGLDILAIRDFYATGTCILVMPDPNIYCIFSYPATMTVQQNFTGWWSIWIASGYKVGIIRKEYSQLDRIFPVRIRTAEEFLWRQDEKLREVNKKPILKIHENGKR
jgi:hypothetical protein